MLNKTVFNKMSAWRSFQCLDINYSLPLQLISPCNFNNNNRMLLDLGIIRGVDQEIGSQIIFININGLRIIIFMLIKSICSV